jgi:hypothetical protein
VNVDACVAKLGLPVTKTGEKFRIESVALSPRLQDLSTSDAFGLRLAAVSLGCTGAAPHNTLGPFRSAA